MSKQLPFNAKINPQKPAFFSAANNLHLGFASAGLIWLTTPGTSGGAAALADNIPGNNNNILAQAPPVVDPPHVNDTPSILPTDITPLALDKQKTPFAQNLQIRMLQFLPERFYATGSMETSIRYENNPYQFPTRPKLLHQILPNGDINALPAGQQQQVRNILNLVNRQDGAFRFTPNVTAGWAFTGHTRGYVNYFLIRDSFLNQVRLNTVVQSLSAGIQHDWRLGEKTSLQADLQTRELWQTNQQPIFDYLPNLTLTTLLAKNTAVYVSTLLQLRGQKPFQAPTKELDAFYSFGLLHQRGGWSFLNSATFIQNFREGYPRPIINQNNYSWILDFEIARRINKSVPGLQAFVRTEPIFNSHSRARPGISGVDVRVFGGLRYSAVKKSIAAGVENIRQDLLEEEDSDKSAPKPSAMLPYDVLSTLKQSMHGFIAVSRRGNFTEVADTSSITQQ